MTASEKLGKQIDFSTAYAKNAQVVVVKEGSNITKDTLKDAVIAVERGSAGATVVDETVKPTKEAVKLDKQLDALFGVANGAYDAAIIDLTMAQSKLGKGEYTGLKLVDGAQFSDEVFAVGLRQNSNLVSKLNDFLAAKYADGTMAALSAKYEDAIVINTEAFAK
jgi:ABC-type amino acid transport substrate-binding protein